LAALREAIERNPVVAQLCLIDEFHAGQRDGTSDRVGGGVFSEWVGCTGPSPPEAKAPSVAVTEEASAVDPAGKFVRRLLTAVAYAIYGNFFVFLLVRPFCSLAHHSASGLNLSLVQVRARAANRVFSVQDGC
jgi:hypothetical protein